MDRIPHRSWVEVSRRRIADNFHAVQALVGQRVEVMPVVKADAYRHGSAEISKVLESEGANWLAVSSVEEGVTLRQAGINSRILVMADFLPWEREALVEHSLTPAVHSLEAVRLLEQFSRKTDAPIPYHLKIDSGMGRLGIRNPTSEILSVLSETRHAQLEGVMTHFASAASYTSDQTDQQIAAFGKVTTELAAAGIRPRYSHMSATIAIAYGRREAWGSMVRPGHAIYGYVSPVRGDAPEKQLMVKPALEWKAAVVQIKDVPKGTPIGYGAIFRTPKPMRIGVLSVGYADGLPHRLSNKGHVLAAGNLVPILGAISMDLTTVDLTDTPAINAGDAVTLLGESGDRHIDAQQMARTAGTISYSVLCGISARVKRIYL